jgi:transposase
VLLVRSRRTSRLDCIVHHLGLALGGRPAASFAKRLMLPVSIDTVLRVVRDRGGGYGEAASKALPSAFQVADRWHLMENAGSVFLNAVLKSMHPIRAAIGATTINPELLTCAERLQYEGYLRREETITTILALAKDGTTIKQIVRKTGHSRNRVRQVLRGDRGDVFRTRSALLM